MGKVMKLRCVWPKLSHPSCWPNKISIIVHEATTWNFTNVNIRTTVCTPHSFELKQVIFAINFSLEQLIGLINQTYAIAVSFSSESRHSEYQWTNFHHRMTWTIEGNIFFLNCVFLFWTKVLKLLRSPKCFPWHLIHQLWTIHLFKASFDTYLFYACDNKMDHSNGNHTSHVWLLFAQNPKMHRVVTYNHDTHSERTLGFILLPNIKMVLIN